MGQLCCGMQICVVKKNIGKQETLFLRNTIRWGTEGILCTEYLPTQICKTCTDIVPMCNL